MRQITFYEPDTGHQICTCSVQLPLGIAAEDATEADWADAVAAMEASMQKPSVPGECGANQKVVAGAFVDIAPVVPTLEEAKLARWEALKIERDRQETLGFLYRGKRLQSDERSVQRINTVVQAAQAAAAAGAPFQVAWTCADNSVLQLDTAGVLGMPVALAGYANQLHLTARALREQLLDPATDTFEKVGAVEWPAPTSL